MEATAKNTSHIELRMTDEQKVQIEEPARICGTPLSQWCIDRLLESARATALQNDAIVMRAEAFDTFERLLDGPANDRFEEAAASTTRWSVR